MEPELLPPQSPGPDPLEYAVFGHRKRRWQKHFPPGHANCDERCAAFVQHL